MEDIAITPACDAEHHEQCMGQPDSSTVPCHCVCHFGRLENGRWLVELQPIGDEDKAGRAAVFQHFALLAALKNDPRQAARLLGHTAAQFQRLGYERNRAEQMAYDNLAALLQTLNADEMEKLAAEGAAWSEGRAIAEARKV